MFRLSNDCESNPFLNDGFHHCASPSLKNILRFYLDFCITTNCSAYPAVLSTTWSRSRGCKNLISLLLLYLDRKAVSPHFPLYHLFTSI